MNKNKISNILLVLINLILIALIVWKTFNSENKIAYVKLSDVYNKFNMKQELEGKFKTIESTRKNLIDSIEFNAAQIQKKGDKEEYQQVIQNYIQKRKELEQANETLSNQYDESIWKQINSYSEEFGKANGYKMIFGADGSGTLMYAEKNIDVTDEFIAFINKMYNGKQNSNNK